MTNISNITLFIALFLLSVAWKVFGDAEFISRINKIYSFDKSSQHFGRLRIAAQQIGHEHSRLARQAPGHDSRLAAGSNVRLARQAQC